jgi:hypothetical protein
MTEGHPVPAEEVPVANETEDEIDVDAPGGFVLGAPGQPADQHPVEVGVLPLQLGENRGEPGALERGQALREVVPVVPAMSFDRGVELSRARQFLLGELPHGLELGETNPALGLPGPFEE